MHTYAYVNNEHSIIHMIMSDVTELKFPRCIYESFYQPIVFYNHSLRLQPK